jgi:hypothetical protein
LGDILSDFFHKLFWPPWIFHKWRSFAQSCHTVLCAVLCQGKDLRGRSVRLAINNKKLHLGPILQRRRRCKLRQRDRCKGRNFLSKHRDTVTAKRVGLSL